ncbi:helix-turn-helix transcriptional regulator [Staphylococcus saprophyticus]|nr:helix-turn-helix transcriptional regulator [Staphylococcus saprophyticus]
MNMFGGYIKQLRGDTSIRQAAKFIGLSHTYLDSLEKGYDLRTNSKRSPSVVTVYKIAKHYNVDFKQLCDMVINDIDD